MKHLVFLTCFIASTLFLKAQNPSLNFSANKYEGCAPMVVKFTNASIGYADSSKYRFIWNFITSQANIIDSSNNLNASLNLNKPNDFVIASIQVYDKVSKRIIQRSTSQYITVYGFAGNFTMTDSICPGSKLEFSYMDYFPKTKVKWEYANGDTSNEYRISTYKFTQTGIFPITLNFSDPCETKRFTKNIIVSKDIEPRLGINYYPQFVCSGLEQSISATNLNYVDSLYDFELDLGDGTKVFDQFKNHTYAQNGTYLLKLSATNACGNRKTIIDSNFVGKLYKFPSMVASSFPLQTQLGDSTRLSVNNYSFLPDFFEQSSFAWYVQNKIVATGNNVKFVFPATGTFNCFAILTTCEKDTILPFTHVVKEKSNSINDLHQLNYILYPNPANNTIYLQGQSLKEMTYSITDIMGHTVLDGLCTESIQISSLSKGLYLLHLQELHSNRVQTIKLVKD